MDIVVKTWGEFTPDEVFEMAVLRSEVFFLEQKITEEEFDSSDRDPDTIHLWSSDDTGMTGYLRIVHSPDAKDDHHGAEWGLGRMVVRRDYRGAGVAKALLARALELVGSKPLYLHSQEYITGLYQHYGFEPRGELFMEAGIPHRLMVRAAGA
jgi:ElaA protein